MKRLLASLTIGLTLLLAAGAVVASEHEGTGSESREGKFYGRVESLPVGLIGAWRISGREVKVTESTIIREEHGRVRIGAYVEVEGSVSGNILNARKIETKSNLN